MSGLELSLFVNSFFGSFTRVDVFLKGTEIGLPFGISLIAFEKNKL